MRGIPHEIIVVDDASSDRTVEALDATHRNLPELVILKNPGPHGFGRAIIHGIDHMKGDAVVIMMADESDDCRDVVRYWTLLNDGYECVFGSRFLHGGGVIDYPRFKLAINRLANFFIRMLFRIQLNDTTNAFKAYRRTVIDGCRPYLSPHFNLTIEIPLKAIVRGYSWKVVPITWRNRRTGAPKLKIREMGSRYLFICLYVWLEKYFSRLPERPQPDEATTTEPPQNSERKVALKDRSQPLYLEGYHRPDYRSKDDAVFDAITDLMSEGRTSRLYRALVRDKKIASFSAGFSGMPGTKYPHLFAFYAVPLPGHTTSEMADAIHVEIDKIKKEDITDDELKMIKTRSKANLIRGLADNEGLATQLATYQTRYGDWRELFRSVDRIDQVTKADIRRISNEIFVDTNRTIGVIENTGGGGAPSGGDQPPTNGADQGGAQ